MGVQNVAKDGCMEKLMEIHITLEDHAILKQKMDVAYTKQDLKIHVKHMNAHGNMMIQFLNG